MIRLLKASSQGYRCRVYSKYLRAKIKTCQFARFGFKFILFCSIPDKSVFDELAMQKQNASKVELTNNLFSIEQSSLENCSLFEYQIPANKNIDLVIRRSFVVF